MPNNQESETSEMSSRVYLYEQFIDTIAYIFKQAGYEVIREHKIKDIAIDLVVKDEEEAYAVEVKYITNFLDKNALKRVLTKTLDHASLANMTLVLVISSIIERRVKERIKKSFPKLIIIDLANLLYIANNGKQVYDRIVSCLPTVVDGIVPVKTDQRLNLSWLEHGEAYQSIVDAIMQCEPGKKEFASFEKACVDALKYAFAGDLALWKEQAETVEGLFRFDLVCRIKDGNQKSFWKIMEQFFHTKYIVFEFKNYTDKVNQSVVFTSEKYLYPKALRTVGIIISANGTDKHAISAANGVFRETGKLLLLLDKDDLLQMCAMKNEDDDPSDLLMDKLDQLLCELDK